MAKFIEVTDNKYGHKTLVNIDKIIQIESGTSGSHLTFYFKKEMHESCVNLNCSESYDEIMQKLKEADAFIG